MFEGTLIANLCKETSRCARTLAERRVADKGRNPEGVNSLKTSLGPRCLSGRKLPSGMPSTGRKLPVQGV
jgi:hypothetical protein